MGILEDVQRVARWAEARWLGERSANSTKPGLGLTLATVGRMAHEVWLGRGGAVEDSRVWREFRDAFSGAYLDRYASRQAFLFDDGGGEVRLYAYGGLFFADRLGQFASSTESALDALAELAANNAVPRQEGTLLRAG